MYSKFIVALFVLSFASGKCGLLNWFSGWTDQLGPRNANIKCRERRETEEHGIGQEITGPAPEKIVSLMDIEEGKPTSETEQVDKTPIQGYSKTKRCPKERYLSSFRAPIVGAAPMMVDPLPLVKRESEHNSKKTCTACRNQSTCRLLKKCGECDKYCNEMNIFTSDGPTSQDNPIVGMASKMGGPKNDNIFSKTLYPISTYREGETKDIICRIVGITDPTDIETVTIWVTTFSNNPPRAPGGIDGSSNKDPRRQENLSEHKLRNSEPKQMNRNESPNKSAHILPVSRSNDGQLTQPQLKPRFNDYDDDGDSFGQIRNLEENIRENPDLIEGPPPFLRSSNKENMVSETDNPPAVFGTKSDMKDNIIGSVNKNIIVQPKEFQSDESDEGLVVPTTELVETTELPQNSPKPSLLNRLKELKSLRKSDEGNSNFPSPLKTGFLQNLLKSRQGPPEKNLNIFPSTAPSLDNLRNIETPSENSIQNAPTKPSEGSNGRLSDINVALQEVKAMVKNIQDEAQKGSEKRLLGSPHIENIPEAAASDVTPGPAINSIHSVVPPQVVDNFKKVNKYIINRAQDALDTIGHQETKEKETKPSDSDLERDHHSNMTKNLITDFKKMPQFILKKFEDSLNAFEGKPKSTTKAESDSESSERGNEQVELSQRFGEVDSNNIDNTVGTQDENIDPKTNEPLLGLPERPDLDEETPTTKPYKNKLEKYLAELKDKRQKMYSPEKYLKGISNTGEKNSQAMTNKDKILNPEEQPNLQRSNSPTQNFDRGLLKPDILKSQSDLGEQRALLKEKVKKYVDDIKFRKNSTPDLDIVPKSASNPTNLLSNIEEPPNLGMKPHSPFSRMNDIIDSNAINQFLPTLPSASKTGLDQFAEAPSKFMKYLQDIKAKTPLISTPKSVISPFGTDVSPRNNAATANNILTDIVPKKDLLKDKIKNYVGNLNKKADEKIAETGLPLTPRAREEFNNLNQATKPANLFEPFAQDSKKDLLKEKLKNYVSSLKKPMESRMSKPSDITNIPGLARNSLEPQKKELNALKKKLEGLLRERMAKPSKSLFNPLISESQPNQEQTASDNNDVVPVFNGAENIKDPEFGNAGNGELATIPNDHLGAANPSEELIKDSQDTNLQSRGGFAEDVESADWSNQLGKIVQTSSKPKDIFFIGNGIKLPLQLKQGPDGNMDLSVDLEKLCSCYNSTCTKNNAAIEETVGAILEKEAELKDQLNLSQGSSNNDVKIERVPKKGLLNNLISRLSEADNQNGKSNIFKRSSDVNGVNMELTTLKNMLELFTKDNDNPNNDITNNNLALPKLPTVEEVANELTDFGSKFKDNVRELNKDIAGTFGIVAKSPDNNEAFSKQTIQSNLKKMKNKADEINNQVFKRLEHENNLKQLLRANKIDNINENPNLNIDKYIKNLEREKTMKKLLKQLNLSQTPTDNTLRQIESQANSIIKNTVGNRFNFPKIPTTEKSLTLADQLKENFKNALPIPQMQDRFAEVNDNLAKISDVYQNSKIDALENKLKQLDNEVEKYEQDNEKLLAEESKKFFGGHNNEIIQKEVNLIGKVFSWLKGLSGSSNGD